MNTTGITKTVFKVGDFVSWQRSDSLILTPKFQRRAIWKPGAKSFFIDTIFRGLPVPIIFMRELPADLKTLKSKREIVDGQQRLRTLLSFISPDLLEDYKKERDFFTVKSIHSQELANKTFDELRSEIKQKILEYEFSVHILPSGIDDREVLEMFSRMNATGVKLNNQELRNAAFYGYFKTTAYRLAIEQLPNWRNWKIFNDDQIARMGEVEFTSDLMLCIVQGIIKKKKELIDQAYKKYDENFSAREQVMIRFRYVMEVIQVNLGKNLSNSILRRKTVFFGLFFAIYDKIYQGEPINLNPKPKSIPKSYWTTVTQLAIGIEKQNADQITLNSISKRTSDLTSRQTIINYFKSV